MEIRPILSALLRSKTGAILVAVQVAISMAILSNALHIVDLRQQVAARPSGIADEGGVFFLSVRHLDSDGFEQSVATQKQEAQALRAVPGVLSVAAVNQVPLSQSGNTNDVSISRTQIVSTASTSFYASPDSLVDTFGLKLVEGRDFSADEVVEVDPGTTNIQHSVAIITRALASKLFPGQPAVGKEMLFGTGDGATGVRIIGVVERFQSHAAQTGPTGEYSTIVPMRFAGAGATYAVRAAAGERDRAMKDAEAAIRKLSPAPVIIRAGTLDEVRVNRYRGDQALCVMLVIVSSLLLLVTASGIVGMASLWVTQRRKQIGVRRALGARRIDILRYFITENLMITTSGVVAGVLLSIGLNQLLVNNLEMAKLPLAYLLAGSGVFWALGVIAVYGPAWRAASISPALATRSA